MSIITTTNYQHNFTTHVSPPVFLRKSCLDTMLYCVLHTKYSLIQQHQVKKIHANKVHLLMRIMIKNEFWITQVDNSFCNKLYFQSKSDLMIAGYSGNSDKWTVKSWCALVWMIISHLDPRTCNKTKLYEPSAEIKTHTIHVSSIFLFYWNRIGKC